MASELRVDRIVPTTGVPTGGGGGIIQVVQVTKTDQFATSSTSYTDVTGLSASITPIRDDSKILVRVCVMIGTGNTANDNLSLIHI